jgi:hypothetical protein
MWVLGAGFFGTTSALRKTEPKRSYRIAPWRHPHVKRLESDAGGKYGYYVVVPQMFFKKIHAFMMKAFLKIG